MAAPEIKVEIAFGGTPLAPTNWTDVTDYVRKISTNSGRNYELDKVEAGTLTLTLDNEDGRFTPERQGLGPELLEDNVATGSDTLGTVSKFTKGANITMQSSTANSYEGARNVQAIVQTGSLFDGDIITHTNAAVVSATREYKLGMYVRRTTTVSDDITVRCRVRWYDASDAVIGSADSADVALVAATAGTWFPVSFTAVAPGGAVAGKLFIINRTGGVSTSVHSDAWTFKLNGSPYYPMVIPRRPVRITATRDAVTTPVWYGYVERWPVDLSTRSAMVEVQASDGFNLLSGIDFSDTLYHALVEREGPTLYYTFTDEADATSVQNRGSGPFGPAVLTQSKYLGGSFEFGADAPFIQSRTGASLLLNEGLVPLGTKPEGYYLKTTMDSNPFATGSWTFDFWIKTSQAGVNDAAGLEYRADIFKLLDKNNKVGIWFGLGQGSGDPDSWLVPYVAWQVGASTPGYFANGHRVNDGQWHHIVYIFQPGALFIWIDGKQIVASGVTAGNEPPALTGPLRANICFTELGTGLGYTFIGNIAHMSLTPRLLSGSVHRRRWDWAKTGHSGYNRDVSDNVLPDTETHRMWWVLDLAEWPSGSSRAFTSSDGLSELAPGTYGTGTNALALCQDAATAASGAFLMDRAGAVLYVDRAQRVNADVVATFAESAGTGVEAPLMFTSDSDLVRNDVRITRTGGATARVVDDDSIANYGRKVDSAELGILSDDEAQDAAAWRILKYANATARVDTVSIAPTASATEALWPAALAVKFGDRIRLAELPDNAPYDSADFFVERVAHDVLAIGGTLGADWLVSYQLSPAANTDGWILEDDVFGILDDTTILTY